MQVSGESITSQSTGVSADNIIVTSVEDMIIDSDEQPIDLVPYDTVPNDTKLYPAFGEVTDVDWVSGYVCVRLIEQPFPNSLRLPLYMEQPGIGPLSEVGQLFRANATLSISEPERFQLGDIRLVPSSPEKPIARLRRMATPTTRIVS
jgi:hypothetical protein